MLPVRQAFYFPNFPLDIGDKGCSNRAHAPQMKLPANRLLRLEALIVIAFFLAAPFRQTSAQVANGGFETGDFTGWTPVDSSNFTNVGSNPLFAHSGTYHANLGAEGVLGSLSQNVGTTSGTQYDLTFWLANDSGASPNEFDVLWNGVTVLSLSDAPVSNYTQYSLLVTATSSSSSLEFQYRNDDDFFRLDEVSINVVPEPSTLSLLLLGAAAAGASVLRRRKIIR
jgi:PEP-CTERM motif